MDPWQILIGMAIIVSITIIVGVYISFHVDNNYPLAIAIGVVAVTTFFGVLVIESIESPGSTVSEVAMKKAMGASIVVEYLSLVAIAAFFTKGSEQLPPITQTLITNFTAIVGILIAFYFGSSAYVEASRNVNSAPSPASSITQSR